MPKKILAAEYPPLDENEKILDLAERLKAKITADNIGGIMRRDAHPKMHGLVKAEFIVDSDLPAELRVGLFAQPGVYQAWIRFSNQNGTIQPDIKGDIRGMAIKVMGVPGEKILPDPALARTQDFILISTNVFVTADAAQFDGLIRAADPLFQHYAIPLWRCGRRQIQCTPEHRRSRPDTAVTSRRFLARCDGQAAGQGERRI